MFSGLFLLKNLDGIDICCTFALAFAQKSSKRAQNQINLSYAECSRFSTRRVKNLGLGTKERVL